MIPNSEHLGSTKRQRIFVQGIVQGVGFRPFVYGLASELGLAGYVLNDDRGVMIEVEGPSPDVETFTTALTERAPPLARVDFLSKDLLDSTGESGFSIIPSQGGSARNTLVSPDVATCDDCLAEMLDPANRRHHYPFTNCTNCGPRFTIIQDIPYDRDKTTMRVFPMCPDCQREYEDPLDRRFHAQPNACPVCGPHVELLETDHVAQGNGHGEHARTRSVAVRSDAISMAAEALAAGRIVAIKGLGGYHLACHAFDGAAVGRLRRRKHRAAKPFALMVPDLATAKILSHVSLEEADLLRSRRRPIVLLDSRSDSGIPEAVAPGLNTLGLMLPYTPLHVLLLEAFAEHIEPGQAAALIMTSANVSDEPIAFRDQDALERLGLIADAFLVHDREIHMRCDDSVIRVVEKAPHMLRRARGYAPEPLTLKEAFPVPVLACGGQLKNTFCLGRDKQAFVSHHIGDLANFESMASFTESIDHYRKLFGVEPEVVAYDLHPEYLATRYAFESAIPTKIGVQHHHAHIASVLAEHCLPGPVIGIAADGTGYGTDGAIWGGEVMLADLVDFQRLAHLAYVPLPGGEQAIRQPWRMGAVYLQYAFGNEFERLESPFMRNLDPVKWRAIARMIRRGLNTPATSSMGRLFDAVAALLGLRTEVQYEGQAAIELETLAEPLRSGYPFRIRAGDARPALLDVRPVIRAIVEDLENGLSTSYISGRFHRTIAEMLLEACRDAREQSGVADVALSGGVFQNKLLLQQLRAMLEADGFQVYVNRLVPPNDGGLSLGQAAVAAARLERSASGTEAADPDLEQSALPAALRR